MCYLVESELESSRDDYGGVPEADDISKPEYHGGHIKLQYHLELI